MTVIMGFRFMTGMIMVMTAVVARVVVVVYVGRSAMGVLVEMLVQVLVCMSMGVLMAVFDAVVGMVMGMRVRVIMSVQMLVLVLSFHDKSSLS